MMSSLGLFLLLLTFSSYISSAYAAKANTQSVLFDRVDELLTRYDKTDSNLRFRPNIPQQHSFLSTKTKSRTGQTESTTDSGNDAGDTLFDEDFSVTTPEESADPLSNVNEQTQQNAQTEQTNAQEDRLLNKETQATTTSTEETEEASTTAEPDTSLNPSTNPDLADKIDDIREEYGLPGISQAEATTETEAQTEEAATTTPESAVESQEEEIEEAVSAEPSEEAEAEAETEEIEGELEPAVVVTDIDKQIQDENIMFGGEDIDQDWEVQYAIFFCMALTALIIIVVYLRNLFDKYCNHVLMRRVSYVSRDVITILMIITLILWLRLQGVNIFNIQVNKVGLSCSVFALGWFAWCVYVVLFAQARSVNWENKEIQCNMRVKILREYQILYDKIHHGQSLNRDQKKAYQKYQGELKYFLLRQNFILPSYLPIIRESILREDFNFAGYLTLCLEKGLEHLFKISSATIISVFIVVQYWSGIAQIDNDLLEEILFGGLIPLVSSILLQRLKSNFNLINENIRTPLEDPHRIELIKHDNQKDPWVNLKNRTPPYLDNLKNVFFHPERTLKGQKRPNLHESLFWAGSPAFSLTILHITAVLQIIWATVYFGYYLPNNTTLINIIYSVIIIGVFVFNLFYLVPSALFIYTVISNIEMRKDRELIKTTVAEQRKQLKDSLVKLYRLLKSAKREFTSEGSPGIHLKDFMVQIIKESFRKINPNLWEIKIQDLPKLAHLCGSKLEKDELVYLARSASQDLQTIIIDDFIWTVERTTKDVKLDPYATSCDVLRALNTRDDDFFILKEFRELLVNHKVLSALDIEEILYELRYFSKNGMEVEIPGIASLIRNTIEESPR